MIDALSPPADPPDGAWPEPLTEEPHRASVAAVIGTPAMEWAVFAADQLCRFVFAGVPAVGGGPGPERMLRRSAESRILDILVHLARGTEPERATSYAVAVAGDFARRGVELQDALGGVTLGHQFLNRSLLEVVESVVPPEERFGAGRVITDLLFRYHNIQLADVAAAYKTERVRWTASTDAARRATVLDVLAGKVADPRDVGQTLEYDLGGHHLALVVWHEETSFVRALSREAVRFGRALGCSRPLVVVEDGATVWAWIGRPAAFTEEDLAFARGHHPAEDGVRIALGARARGVEGFRSSHRIARKVRATSSLARTRRPVVDYDELGLVSLLAEDRAAAAWFVRSELGDLAAPDPKTEDIRETVRCYLGTGGSLVAAARELRVARNTIVYRLKRAEELRGRSVRHRVAELHAALELLHVWTEALPDGG